MVAPIFDVPPHAECPTGPVSAWFTEPAGVVLQLMEATAFTAEMARWLTGPGLSLLQERYGDTRLIIVLDIRPMTGREPIVRTVFMDAARQYGARFDTVVIVPPLQMNPVYLTGLHAAAALVSAFGPRFDISTDVDQVLSRNRIRLAS